MADGMKIASNDTSLTKKILISLNVKSHLKIEIINFWTSDKLLNLISKH